MQLLCQNVSPILVRKITPDTESDRCSKADCNSESQRSNALEVDLYFLEGYGISRKVLEALVFEHGGNPTLLEIQIKGILMGLLDSQKLLNVNGIISGPTGSGKTLLAEFRMLIRYFAEGRIGRTEEEPHRGRGKTIFLVPLKALGLEKWNYFQNVYSRFGLQILYSDGDLREDDGKILKGQFDVAILSKKNSNSLRSIIQTSWKT